MKGISFLFYATVRKEKRLFQKTIYRFSLAPSALLLFVAMVVFVSAKSQNLVPNGSFEDYLGCPSTLDDIQAIGWTNSRESCDYFHACYNEFGDCGLGVPCNVFGYQEAFEGEAYIGFIQFTSPSPEYREQVACELVEPLVLGETYYFSMQINRGNSEFINKASNGQGILLTNEEYNSEINPSPAFEGFTLINTEIVADSSSWTEIRGNFIATEEYSRLVIGGFLESELLDTASIGTPLPFGEAYYFIDDIRLSADSSFVYSGVHSNTSALRGDLFIYPNPSDSKITFNKDLINSVVTLSNTKGEVIFRIEDKSVISELDFSWLPKGNYFISILSKYSIHHIKFIKL